MSQSVFHMRFLESRSRTGYSSKATSASGPSTTISESLHPVGDVSPDDYAEEELKPYKELEESESRTNPPNWHHSGRREKSLAVENGRHFKNKALLGIPIRYRRRGSGTKTGKQQLSSEDEKFNQNPRASCNTQASGNGWSKVETGHEQKDVTKSLTRNTNCTPRRSMRIIYHSRPIGTLQSRQRVPTAVERLSENTGQDSVYTDVRREKPRMIPKIVRAG